MAERNIEVKHVSEGWFLTYGERTVGPFKYLDEVDHVKVAEQLGVEPKDVWKAKMRISAYETTPRIVEQPSSIYDNIIELEEHTISPSFTALMKSVHPAVGIVDERAYIGVQLPCMVIPKGKPRKEDKAPTEEHLWFLITSMKEKILCNKEVLKKLNWRLAYRPTVLENRWSLKSIQSFLNGATVEPESVFFAVKAAWEEYIEFDEPVLHDLVTLWTIGTYFFHLFNTYPYLYIGGVKRTGKTKNLNLASVLCFNAIFSGNVSTASIFRLIQSGRCSFLMDETEKLINPERAQDFRNLLLCGYKKGAPVYRTERSKGDKLVPEPFEVYSPKMLANIQGIEPVLEDRCIDIIMKRGKNRTILNREVDINDTIWQEIRDQLYILFLMYWREVLEIYQDFGAVSDVSDICDGIEHISDRELELWKPVFSLAKFFDRYVLPIPSQTTQTTQMTLFQTILSLAIKKTKEKRIENMTETGDYILVQMLLAMVKHDDYYEVKAIKDRMAVQFEEEQKWLNTKWVGRALKRLGFTDKRRLGRGRQYRLMKKSVEDLADRLGIEKHLFEPEDVLTVAWLPESRIGECGYCGKESEMRRVATLFDHRELPLCDDCSFMIEDSLGGKTEAEA